VVVTLAVLPAKNLPSLPWAGQVSEQLAKVFNFCVQAFIIIKQLLSENKPENKQCIHPLVN
jgi:hypothetical protein